MKLIFSKCLAFLVLTFFLSCGNEAQKNQQSTIIDLIEEESILGAEKAIADDSIQVVLSVSKFENNLFDLRIEVLMADGSWIVSPLEKDFPYGRMQIDFDEHNFMKLIDSICINPESKYKYDDLVEKPYRIITRTSVLKQKIKMTSGENFELTGKIFFLLEPICTPIEIYFKIVKQGDGITVFETDERHSASLI